MNIIEAIKSGKRFKRRCWPENEWNEPILEPETSGLTVSRVVLNPGFKSAIIVADLLAEDWEIDVPVVVTRDKFTQAWRDAVGFNEPYSALACDAVAKELGL